MNGYRGVGMVPREALRNATFIIMLTVRHIGARDK